MGVRDRKVRVGLLGKRYESFSRKIEREDSKEPIGSLGSTLAVAIL